MQQLTMPLGNLPLNLTLVSNGCIAITARAHFAPIFDNYEDGLQAVIMDDKLVVNGQEFLYNRLLDYKHELELKAWLVAQKLDNPFEEM